MNYRNKSNCKHQLSLWTLLLPLCLFISGCDDQWWKIEDDDVSGSAEDITDKIFTERSEDCDNYVGDYKALVTDISNQKSFEASLKITSSNNQCSFVSNSIANHDFNNTSADFDTDVEEINLQFYVSQDPQLASITIALSETTSNAIFLNGIVLALHPIGCYRPDNEFAGSDGNAYVDCGDNAAWYIDALGLYDNYGADQHNGLTYTSGQYHYHGGPNALFDAAPESEGSPVIGFAADGFPIYGSYFFDEDEQQLRKAISGYSLKEGIRQPINGLNPADDSENSDEYDGTYLADWEFTDGGDLDECNGMTIDQQYGYYVTDTYPWVMACFSGTPNSSFK